MKEKARTNLLMTLAKIYKISRGSLAGQYALNHVIQEALEIAESIRQIRSFRDVRDNLEVKIEDTFEKAFQ